MFSAQFILNMYCFEEKKLIFKNYKIIYTDIELIVAAKV